MTLAHETTTDLSSPSTDGRVVVGVTGSDASAQALAWALDVAARRGWAVDVVTAWPDLGEPLIHEVPGHYSDARGRAVEGLRSALARRENRQRDPEVRVFVDNADPVEALVARSRGADLLVVGVSRGGQSRRRGLPPVAEECRRLVECPLVVVDPQTTGQKFLSPGARDQSLAPTGGPSVPSRPLSTARPPSDLVPVVRRPSAGVRVAGRPGDTVGVDPERPGGGAATGVGPAVDPPGRSSAARG